SYPTSGTSSSITNTNPDCCRSNYSPRVTLGGFILEWCIANTTRGSPYCQKRSGLVTTYSQTIGLQPLNSNGQPLYYDIYVDYQTIQSGIVPWKVMKGVNQLCFASSCNYTVTWAKPYFSAKLNQAGTSTSACTGYSNCVDTVASFPEDNPFPKFTSLPPDLPVDLTVQVRPMENSGAIVNHWIARGLVTPTCSLKNPTAPTVPFNSSGVLTGIGGNQSVSLSWAAPNNWGVECNYTNPREYLVAIGQTNPPPFYGKTTANNITISNLNPGTTYYWAIAAENQANLWGPYTYVQSFTTAPPVATNNFTGEYFDNIDFTNKKIVRTDQKISFNWGANSPDTSIAVDTFSIRWTGTFNFDSAKYRFNANVNDKVVVYVDNDLVLDGSVGSATYNQLKNISAGVHTVRIEYIENTDSANITANWVHADTCYDMDGNGAVNLNDILIVQKHLGAIGLSPWDLNGDKVVSSVDTDLVRTSVGKLCQ
ncbi:MAG TPA: PA14 domain-containing protein, partial [Candidatus Saccharimonadales bacterium]|nr:PA14 domain-containing protein [Candidatus Saccharimonadales bacterium]